MKPLLIVHHLNHRQWLSLQTAAQQLAPEFDLLLCAPEPQPLMSAAASVNHLPWQPALSSETLVAALLPLCVGRPLVLMAADLLGKEVLPQLAAKLDWPMLSGVTAFTEQQFVRHGWAGSVEQHWQHQGGSLCLTVEANAFKACADLQQVMPTTLPQPAEDGRVTKQLLPLTSQRPHLSDADTVIAVGRGVIGTDAWLQVEALADRLGAAIGGTRPVIDAGLLPPHLQIGQTGQQIAPKRYIGLGVFGASQHLAGIKQAQLVVAVNCDNEAPLMQQADYAYCGDLHQVLPELLSLLEKTEI
ncbi:electron transfer flavoprotein subunit alpha/FixB family protein [Ferrimonas senticii]|uniref:electron transfer flavoprotein subunit alpha/FixB family protein n=1 Tax=Ferrimonas senticii TaxID=394566 RepID=UPI0004159749|nr:electron transfer flavoprotein subunit alpha/FixB family protein [Ferrimonas senticii]